MIVALGTFHGQPNPNHASGVWSARGRAGLGEAKASADFFLGRRIKKVERRKKNRRSIAMPPPRECELVVVVVVVVVVVRG